MPQQKIFFEQQTGDKRILVLKSYDPVFAREAFDQMQPEALSFLEQSFKQHGESDAIDMASLDYADALWEMIQEGAREDWNTFSYFVVSEETAGHVLPLFVSSDWPSAEAFVSRYTSGTNMTSN